MRLIDVDGIKNSLLTELLMGVDGGTDASYLKTYEVINRIENIVNEWVDNQPTVEAIPIEWIKDYIFRMWCTEYDNPQLEGVERLLRDWREENE